MLWKETVSALSENCVFPQNFHSMKLVEIGIFRSVIENWHSNA